jgi:hypothetical protein
MTDKVHELILNLHTLVQNLSYSCLTSKDAEIKIYKSMYRLDVRFWPVDLCCAVVRRGSASLRLLSMRSDTILPEKQLRR